MKGRNLMRIQMIRFIVCNVRFYPSSHSSISNFCSFFRNLHESRDSYLCECFFFSSFNCVCNLNPSRWTRHRQYRHIRYSITWTCIIGKCTRLSSPFLKPQVPKRIVWHIEFTVCGALTDAVDCLMHKKWREWWDTYRKCMSLITITNHYNRIKLLLPICDDVVLHIIQIGVHCTYQRAETIMFACMKRSNRCVPRWLKMYTLNYCALSVDFFKCTKQITSRHLAIELFCIVYIVFPFQRMHTRKRRVPKHGTCPSTQTHIMDIIYCTGKRRYRLLMAMPLICLKHLPCMHAFIVKESSSIFKVGVHQVH